MYKIFFIHKAILWLLFLPMVSLAQPMTYNLVSPDQQIEINLLLKESRPLEGDNELDQGCLYYEVQYKDIPIIKESQLGIIPMAAPTIISNLEVISTSRDTVSGQWEALIGERSTVPENFHQLILHLRETIPPYRFLDLVFRAYNEGVAFRYYFPSQETMQQLVINNEFTQFQLPEGSTAWACYRNMQQEYKRTLLPDLENEISLPLTLELHNGVFASILEVNVQDYSRMQLNNYGWMYKNTLLSHLSSPVTKDLPFFTSWKLILIGESPNKLLEHNYMVENLNPPNQIRNTDWIKPGKMMREMTLSTQGAKEYIDFAAAHNLQYILFDGGWYGSPIIDQTDANEALPWKHKIKSSENEGLLDLEDVINYGNEKDVGVFLYLDRRVAERRLDYLLPHYQKLGVKGLKLGFVRVKSHEWTNWLHETIAKCAQYKLLVDVHDEYYPTGFSRTYPNLLTQEGILGNEAMPDADHNVNLPFTRMLAGAADYTPAYYSRKEFGKKRSIQNTPAHQLALPVIIYSPLQSLFWYDHPDDYQGEPEVEFWEKIPTTWDETKVLGAKMGEYVIIARRKGNEWFVGGITNTKERTIDIYFDFLESNRTWNATIYSDGGKWVKTRTNVAIDIKKVTKNDKMSFNLNSSGGVAIYLEKME